MMDDDTAEELRERIHNLYRSVSNARLLAMVTDDLEERFKVAADILDTVEKELQELEDL